MKSKKARKSKFFVMAICITGMIVFTSCENLFELTQKKYDSFGEWPEYAGSWRSGSQLVGEKWADAAYFKISINEDGTFEGTYEGYYQSGNMGINVGLITVYYPVFDPDGNEQEVFGALDFDNGQGIGTFGDTDDVEFSVTIDSSDGEIWFYFDSGFEYDMGYVE